MSGADRINCSLHGDSEVTIVCLHIVETLHDRAARGFWWALDDDGEYQATCTLCHEMDRDEFDARVRELGINRSAFPSAAKIWLGLRA
jgi:hypothetical protein